MQDKSFQQAIQALHGSLSTGFQDAICHMISYRTTVTNATSDIQDEKVRTVVTKTLIVGQITVLLALMRDIHLLNDAHYREFTAYLQDEKVGTVATKTLIVGQIIVLLALMRDMRLLNDAHYREFTAYLLQTCNYPPQDWQPRRNDSFLIEPNQ